MMDRAVESENAEPQRQRAGREVWAWHPNQMWERARLIEEPWRPEECNTVGVKFFGRAQDKTNSNSNSSSSSSSSSIIVHVAKELIKEINPEDQDDPDDLTRLPLLDEPNLLYSLKKRFKTDRIYTYTGPVMIAINPWKSTAANPQPSDFFGIPLTSSPPHPFAIAEETFRHVGQARAEVELGVMEHGRKMMFEDVNQSILISGESGAGKTETTKLILFHLVSLQGCRSSPNKFCSAVRSLEQQVLLSNTILQAFGNASTCRNKNSSRYGKFVSLYFSKEDRSYTLEGCSINVFLLERSRVAHVARGERNFHVFYQYQKHMQRYSPLLPPYRLLAGYEDEDGKATLESTEQAMRGAGLLQEEVEDVRTTVGLILSLGNIHFLPVESRNASEGVRVDQASSAPALKAAAASLRCSCSKLEDALCTRRVRLAGEEVEVGRSGERAGEARDAMCKVMYGRLFGWLVRRMNSSLLAKVVRKEERTTEGEERKDWGGEERRDREGGGEMEGEEREVQEILERCEAEGCSVISLLDIFGFESFEANGFEQLLINYANERLQTLFNKHVFAIEQELYNQEGLDFSVVDFVDNEKSLEALEDKQSGLLTLVDEEIKIPGGSDDSLMLKVRTIMPSKHERLTVPKKSSRDFVIHHYAGPVCYDGSSFLDKNRDVVGQDVLQFFSTCQFQFVRALFDEVSSLGRGRQPQPSKTVITSFRRQLACLESIISATQIHFVRCINPNEQKLQDSFDDFFVLKQIRATGILQAAKIASVGFPIKIAFSRFLSRFCLLVAPSPRPSDRELVKLGDDKSARELAGDVLLSAGLTPKDFQLGKSKVFLPSHVWSQLEARREDVLCSSLQVICAYVKRKVLSSRLRAARRVVRRLQEEQRKTSLASSYSSCSVFSCTQLFESPRALAKLNKEEEEQEVLRLRQENAQLRREQEERMTQVRLVCEQLLREYSKTQEMIAVLTSGWTRQDEESQVRRFEGSWEAREQQLLQQISMLEARLLAAGDASSETAMSNSQLQAGLLDKLLEDASKWRVHVLESSRLVREGLQGDQESPCFLRTPQPSASFVSPGQGAGDVAADASPSVKLKRQSLVKKLASRFQVFMPGRHSDSKKFPRKTINKENRGYMRTSSPQELSRQARNRVALMPLQLSSPSPHSPWRKLDECKQGLAQ